MTLNWPEIEIISIIISALVSFFIWVLTNKFSIFAEATTYDYCSKRRGELLAHYHDLINKMEDDLKQLFIVPNGQTINGDSYIIPLRVGNIFNESMINKPHFWKELDHMRISWEKLSSHNDKYSKLNFNDLIERKSINELIRKHNQNVDDFKNEISENIQKGIFTLLNDSNNADLTRFSQVQLSQCQNFFQNIIFDYFEKPMDLESQLYINETADGSMTYNHQVLSILTNELTIENIKKIILSILNNTILRKEYDELKVKASQIEEVIELIRKCFEQCITDMNNEINSRDNFPSPLAFCCPRYDKKKCAEKFGTY